MNRTLLVFGALLVFLGLGYDFYALALFGFLLLIPALLSPSRAPMRPAPSQPRQQVRRISPPAPQPVVSTHAEPATPTPTVSPKPVTSTPTYSPSLFPSAMFPSTSPQPTMAQPTASAPGKGAERDELVEAGTLLAILKLVLG